ncbi:MAG: hypothetical protein P8J33_17450, partial [Pirellulaceae bacterium]|nr:hypothetical protein [Pirellulaceae bacterium]
MQKTMKKWMKKSTKSTTSTMKLTTTKKGDATLDDWQRSNHDVWLLRRRRDTKCRCLYVASIT